MEVETKASYKTLHASQLEHIYWIYKKDKIGTAESTLNEVMVNKK